MNGVACGCGGTGCVETVAGAPGWARGAQEMLAAGRTSSLRLPADQRAIVDAARAGDLGALEVVAGVARAVGMGIAAALQLLNIECVVLGGGVSAAGSFLLDRIVDEVRPRTFAQIFTDCTFRVAELGNDAGVVGAARVGMLGLG
jgi:glucokinase